MIVIDACAQTHETDNHQCEQNGGADGEDGGFHAKKTISTSSVTYEMALSLQIFLKNCEFLVLQLWFRLRFEGVFVAFPSKGNNGYS